MSQTDMYTLESICVCIHTCATCTYDKQHAGNGSSLVIGDQDLIWQSVATHLGHELQLSIKIH
jgi:hypothetical protein